MAARPLRLLVWVLAGVVAVACGDQSEDGSGGRSEISTRDTVTVNGVVFTDFHVDLDCEDYLSDQSLPAELSGIALTFSDAAGEVVGETSTGTLEWAERDYGCQFYAGYQAVLPVGPTYRADFDPPPPGDSGFYGAEELTTQEISFDDLEDDGFRWDFEAPPTYVVSDPPCAFDDTGCLAADLVITVATDHESPSASLAATAGIQANAWDEDGIAGGVEVAMASLGDPTEFPTVASAFHLAVDGTTESVEVVIRETGGGGAEDLDPVHTRTLETGVPEEVTLPTGTYILSVALVGPSPTAFHFGIRVP